LRFTENRELILDVLKKAKVPLTVEEIKHTLKYSVDTSTVYRALNFLEKKQYIDSASFGRNIRFFFCSEKFKHFLFCDKCNRIEVFDDCFAGALEQKINENYNFQIESHVLYFRGLCHDCRNKNKEEV